VLTHSTFLPLPPRIPVPTRLSRSNCSLAVTSTTAQLPHISHNSVRYRPAARRPFRAVRERHQRAIVRLLLKICVSLPTFFLYPFPTYHLDAFGSNGYRQRHSIQGISNRQPQSSNDQQIICSSWWSCHRLNSLVSSHILRHMVACTESQADRRE
jgi:hypothetical protein